MTSPSRSHLSQVGLAWLVTSLGCTPTVCNNEPPPSASQATQPLLSAPASTESHSKANGRLDDWIQRLRHSDDSSYEQPTAARAKEYRAWIRQALQGDDFETQPPAGFRLQTVRGKRIGLLIEEENRRGAAIVVVRKDYVANVFIEVPHSFFDAGTLPIGLALFDELGARGIIINSYHRGGDGTAADRKELAMSGSSPFDVAHQDVSYFQQAHRAALDVAPSAWFVQLHGFSEASAKDVDAIVSPGPTNTDLAPLVRRLRSQIPEFEFRLYPRDIRTLGGTTNVQGKSNRKSLSPFVHLELSPRLRDRLKTDEKLAQRFAGAFWDPPRSE